jgi:hypothetical protein
MYFLMCLVTVQWLRTHFHSSKDRYYLSLNLGLHASYCPNFVTFFDNDNKEIFQGNRDVRTGLWMVDLRTLSTATAGGTNQSASAAI